MFCPSPSLASPPARTTGRPLLNGAKSKPRSQTKNQEQEHEASIAVASLWPLCRPQPPRAAEDAICSVPSRPAAVASSHSAHLIRPNSTHSTAVTAAALIPTLLSLLTRRAPRRSDEAPIIIRSSLPQGRPYPCSVALPPELLAVASRGPEPDPTEIRWGLTLAVRGLPSAQSLISRLCPRLLHAHSNISFVSFHKPWAIEGSRTSSRAGTSSSNSPSALRRFSSLCCC